MAASATTRVAELAKAATFSKSLREPLKHIMIEGRNNAKLMRQRIEAITALYCSSVLSARMEAIRLYKAVACFPIPAVENMAGTKLACSTSRIRYS